MNFVKLLNSLFFLNFILLCSPLVAQTGWTACGATPAELSGNRTIVNAVEALIKKGAKDVHVFVTHAVLSGDAVNKIKKSKIKKLIITDTIDNSRRIKNVSKIQVLSIAPLMAEAIKRISNSTSVSDLFN